MKIILTILFSISAYSQTINLNGYWELIDYNDDKPEFYSGTGAYSQGLFFSDSSVLFLDNIYFSDLVSVNDSIIRDHIKYRSGNLYNKRNYYVDNNKITFLLDSKDTIILTIKKFSQDSLNLKNELTGYEEFFIHKDYSEIIPVNFSKITFSTDYCLGNCPVFNLEIDSTGFLKFEGIDHILFLGKYELQLHDTLLNELKSLISIINWTALDNDYFDFTHGPAKKTKVFSRDILYKEIEDWSGPVSCELKWLYSFFERISKLPFKQKVFDNNIFGSKTLKLRKISKSKDFKKYHNISESENVFLLSELLNTSRVSKSFKSKFYFDTYELIWDENKGELVESDTGTIESDGKLFKFNSEIFELKKENLSEYFEAILEKQNK